VTACSLHREALENAALGGVLPDAARIHLVSCGDCVAALERRRAVVRRFDAVVSERANAQLPSDLGARVLAQVQRGTHRGPLSRPLWRPLVALAVAIIVAVAIARTAFAPPQVAPQRAAAQLASWQSPTAAFLQPVR
jgi:hypothetical protein